MKFVIARSDSDATIYNMDCFATLAMTKVFITTVNL